MAKVKRLWMVLAAAMGLLLVGCSGEAEANAQATGSSFAETVAAAGAWLADAAGGENGEWIGYVLAAIIIVWVLRRSGLMRG